MTAHEDRSAIAPTVGSHSIPDLRIESKQKLSGFALMTSRTPSSLETGFSGVLFTENWIFGTPHPAQVRHPRSMVPLHGKQTAIPS